MSQVWTWILESLGFHQKPKTSKPFGYCPKCGKPNYTNDVSVCAVCRNIDTWREKYETLIAELDEAKRDMLVFKEETTEKVEKLLADARTISERRTKWRERAIRLRNLMQSLDMDPPQGSEKWDAEE